MTLHISGNFIATASKSGQIFFWELSKSVLQAIEKSENRTKKEGREYKDISNDLEETVWEFTAKDRVINVFPMYPLHSASIHGLKWIGFAGNLLAMVSRTGLFRLVAVNFHMRD
jgi:WD40 repeat protein